MGQEKREELGGLPQATRQRRLFGWSAASYCPQYPLTRRAQAPRGSQTPPNVGRCGRLRFPVNAARLAGQQQAIARNTRL
jgi:hypothetical protein